MQVPLYYPLHPLDLDRLGLDRRLVKLYVQQGPLDVLTHLSYVPQEGEVPQVGVREVGEGEGRQEQPHK